VCTYGSLLQTAHPGGRQVGAPQLCPVVVRGVRDNERGAGECGRGV